MHLERNFQRGPARLFPAQPPGPSRARAAEPRRRLSAPHCPLPTGARSANPGGSFSLASQYLSSRGRLGVDLSNLSTQPGSHLKTDRVTPD